MRAKKIRFVRCWNEFQHLKNNEIGIIKQIEVLVNKYGILQLECHKSIEMNLFNASLSQEVKIW